MIHSTMPRDFYTMGYNELSRDDALGTVIYIRETPRLSAMAFCGKRSKPDWHYTFRSREQLDRHVVEYLDGRRATDAYKAKIKAERTTAERGLQVGDVLHASWGYDQTNIDYYEVVALIGSRMVEIREIGAESEETGWLTGNSVPTPGHYIGPVRRCMARNGSVKVRDWGVWARKMESQNVAGVKVYEASRWSSYA